MANSLPSKYRRLTTKDGSPTLELTVEGVVENMHNFHGAFSETDYIYGEALRTALESGLGSYNVLSVGLGIGYNEIMTAAHFLAASSLAEREGKTADGAIGKTVGRLQSLHSYEIDPFLRDSFRCWLTNPSDAELTPEYEQIANLFGDSLGVQTTEIKTVLCNWFEEERLVLQEQFDLSLTPDQPFHVLYYDPFSRKTNPDFWSEQAISRFFEKWAAPNCVISTYAATGALKRALLEHNFNLVKRPGFGGKRESFLGLRGQAQLPSR